MDDECAHSSRARARRRRRRRATVAFVARALATVVAARRAPRARAANAPPTVSWLEPAKGHVAGGATIAIYGQGFVNAPKLTVRFARGSEVTETRGTFHSSAMISAETPARNSVGWTQVTASNDGETFSAAPNVFVKGAGSFLAFVYDDSSAGFFDGARRGTNVHGYHELWRASNATGPYIGGTLVTITAYSLDLGGNTLGANDSYRGPTGGSGTPNPNFPDPNAPMNSPRIDGTFYPGVHLTCRMKCAIDVGGTGSTTEYVKEAPATWLGYTEVMCETPPMSVPAGDPIPSTACTLQISNDGNTYDWANVTFTYSDPIPTVTSISTTQKSVWGARGPFDGNTEVVVKGTNFLPSKYLKCKFGGIPEAGKALWNSDDVSHVVGEPGGRVRWISSTEIRCVTPAFGPAARLRQYPSDTALIDSTKIIGSGAILDVTFSGDKISAVNVLNGGQGYASPPVLSFIGGGGAGAKATPTVTSGKITGVTVTSGGYAYNQGSGAAATATVSNGILTSISLSNGGYGYKVPPDVTFSCSGTCLSVKGNHASAVAIMGPADNCFPEYGCYTKKVVAVRILSSGMYASAPIVSFLPQKPFVQVRAAELYTAAVDPTFIGGYTMQGKGEYELDPQLNHGSWAAGTYDISTAPYDVVAVTQVAGTFPGRRLASADSNPSDRGSLLAPSSEAGLDGSIKPGHQDLVQISNNYNKFGVPNTSGAGGTPTHVGYRNNSAAVKGYWLWSRDVGTPSDCAVSTNPPLNFYTNQLEGHNLDKGTGWISSLSSNGFFGVPGNTDPGNPSKSCLYFLFSDIFVSPSGSDITGHGTAARPYATIQKCIDASLTGARDFYPGTVGASTLAGRLSSVVERYVGASKRQTATSGYGYTVNRDRCVLKDGTYWGQGNRELRAPGRVIQIWAENNDKVTIDCEGASIGRTVFAGVQDPSRLTTAGSVTMQGIITKRCNFPVPYHATDKAYYYGRP